MDAARKLRFYKHNISGLIYDTGFAGWTLSALTVSPAEKVSNDIEIPGRDGSIDIAASVSGGESTFRPRTIDAMLQCSVGTQPERARLINDLVNRLSGSHLYIYLPDDPTRYMVGDVSAEVVYNDLWHCEVHITAKVDPWRYSQYETHYIYSESAATSRSNIAIHNGGRKRIVPKLNAQAATGQSAPNITVTCGETVINMTTAETVESEELALAYNQTRILSVAGSGTLHIRYTEAML